MNKNNTQPNSKRSGLADIMIFSGKVGLDQKIFFSKNMSLMLKSGLTIFESLNIAANSSSGIFKKTLLEVLDSVQSGNTLSISFARYPEIFSGFFISSIHAGEESGTLDGSFKNIAKQLEKEKELNSKIKGAMVYPLIVLSSTFALGIVMSFVVLPKITPLFEGLSMELPATTKTLIWLSHLIQNYGGLIIAGMIMIVLSLLWILKQKFTHPVTHWLLINTPILKNIYKNASLARLFRTMEILLKSGLTIDESLRITQDSIDNFYYKKILAKAGESIQTGAKLSDNLEKYEKYFPFLAVKMIRVGEESGNFDETLDYLAGLYENEVDNATKNLSTIIEPALLIFVGMIVTFFALSIITPIYQITGNIGKR